MARADVAVVPAIILKYKAYHVYGDVVYSSGKRRRSDKARVYIRIGLKAHNIARVKGHRSYAWMVMAIIRTLDHEFSHVYEPRYATSNSWETQARRFERAGAWTRARR